MQSFVLAEVNRVAAGVDSTDYLAARSRGPFSAFDRDELTVQHRLSGLRATFFWDDGEKIGRVLAKSHSISSIDPNRTWDGEGLLAVNEWEGLGPAAFRAPQTGALRMFPRCAQPGNDVAGITVLSIPLVGIVLDS